MKRFFKILKVNFLSLVALPVLLIATTAKLLAKAFEKIYLIAGMALVTFLLYLSLNLLNYPTKTWQTVLLCMGILIGYTAVVAVILLIKKLATQVIQKIVNAFVSVFDGIYKGTAKEYQKIFTACEADYAIISKGDSTYGSPISCFLFGFLRGIDYFLVMVADVTLYLSFGASAVLVGYTLISANSKIQSIFGFGLFTYLGKFDFLTLFSGGLFYVSLMATYIIFFLSVGFAWHEWAEEQREAKKELSKANLPAVAAPSYFANCETKDDLEKRYKALCKALHPDSKGGDEQSFMKMKEEYEKKKKKLK